MKMNQIELCNIKKKALEDKVPIIMDDTLEVVAKILTEIKPNKILEIGTAVGYSAICFSEYIQEDGKIDTIERDIERVKEARENIKKAEVEEKINIYEGDNPEINIEAEIMEEETPESIIDYDDGSDYVSADSTENLGIDDLESTHELKDKVNQEEWDNMSDIEKQRNSDCSKIRK